MSSSAKQKRDARIRRHSRVRKQVQGTAEREPFSEAQFAALMALANKGINRLVDLQKMAVM